MVVQTRSSGSHADFYTAVINPCADFGGLYTFGEIRPFSDSQLLGMCDLDYKSLAMRVFDQLDVGLDRSILSYALDSYCSFESYRTFGDVVPLVEIDSGVFCAELYHGPTFAFKDMALQPFSRILSKIAVASGREYLVLSATSGDTGPATLAGFAGLDNVRVVCIYPSVGVSEIQRLQMTTQLGDNVGVFAIDGNFDDAQRLLKGMLSDVDFVHTLADGGLSLSVANSINLGRVAFQIVYYFDISCKLNKRGIQSFDVMIPSGNFGNALGAFFAKQLGAGISKICVATNPNDVLHDFFSTGVYDIRQRKLVHSFSPAMDILISSNVERVLHFYFGSYVTKDMMQSLDSNGYFELNSAQLDDLQSVFLSHSFSDSECLEGIARCFANSNYVVDPHTSNAYLFSELVPEPSVIISTSSFVKFSDVMLRALGVDSSCSGEEGVKRLTDLFMMTGARGVGSCARAMDLFKKEEIHTRVYGQDHVRGEILKWACR